VTDEDVLLSIFFMPAVLDAMRSAGPMKLEDPLRFGPVVDVVRQAAAGGTVRTLSLIQAGG
jgi:hypothetical protein